MMQPRLRRTMRPYKEVVMKRTFVLMVALALVAALPAGARQGQNTVQIRHQERGCHTWSVNGGPYRAHATIGVARGALVTFTNKDVMRHTLIQTAGPKVTIGSAKMARIGAQAFITFTRPGLYRFTTKFGEDYPGMERETRGEDNVLTLQVIVR
jgi:plastocyanin